MWHVGRLRDFLRSPTTGYLALAVIFAIGVVLRVGNIDKPSVGDEGIYLYNAKMVFLGLRPYEDFFLAHPPLETYIIALSYRLFGVGIIQGRLADVFFSIASMPLIYLVTKRFYGFYPALFTTLLFSTTYGVIHFTKDVWLSSIPLFFSLLATYLFLTGMEENSRRRIALSGVCTSIAVLCKFTGLVVVATILLYLAVRRKDAIRYGLHFLAGFSAIFIPVALLFYSKNLVDDLVLYHIVKVGYPLIARIKLSFAYIFSYYALILVYGLFGLAGVIQSKDRSDADVFYSINAVLGLIMAVSVKYYAQIAPALYFISTSYAFAILGGRQAKKADSTFLIVFIALFASTAVINDARILTCNRNEASRLLDETHLAIEYINRNTAQSDYLVVTEYRLYYVPLLSDRRVLPGLSDMTPYRMSLDLNPERIRGEKAKARYILTYDSRTDEEKLLEILDIKEPPMSNGAQGGLSVLMENTTLVKWIGGINIYLNNAQGG